jgi:hypothetical protein
VTEREQQGEDFGKAVERKAQAAREASHEQPDDAAQPPVSDGGAGQVPGSPVGDPARAKNSGHGKHTADKWNQ